MHFIRTLFKKNKIKFIHFKLSTHVHTINLRYIKYQYYFNINVGFTKQMFIFKTETFQPS